MIAQGLIRKRNLICMDGPQPARPDARREPASIESISLESIELFIAVILMAFMVSIADARFRMVMYVVIAVSVALLSYRAFQKRKRPKQTHPEGGMDLTRSYNTYSDSETE